MLSPYNWEQGKNVHTHHSYSIHTGTVPSTIGYQEILTYLDGEATLEEALDKLKQHSRNYAKRQLTWFRKNPALEKYCRI